MKKVYILGLLLAGVVCSASGQTLNAGWAGNPRDMYGNPVMTKDYSDTKGTPYLTDSWAKGSVKLGDGSTFKGVDLKYDLVEQRLIFKDPKSGTPMGFKEDVKEFTLIVKESKEEFALFRKGFSAEPGTYFQVLADGTVQLIKKQSKVVKVTREFNSASTVKSFNVLTDYYLVKSGRLIRIKKSLKDVLANLDDARRLDDYLKTHDPDIRKEADLVALISQYNSL